MTQTEKDLWRAFVTAWDAGDVEGLGALAVADIVDHQALPGTEPGVEGMKQLNGMLKAAFPDRSTEIHHLLAEDDRVAALHTVRGTHSGEFMGMPPTGRSFEVTSIHIVRVADGKLAEHWGMLDQGNMMMQLGLVPMPPGTESWRPPPTRPQVSSGGTGDPDSHRKMMGGMIAAIREGRLDDVLARGHGDVVDHAAIPGQAAGKEGVRWRFEQLFGGMSDPEFTVQTGVGDGPFLSQAYTFTATHTGHLMGMPPTNKPFRINAIDFVLIEDGTMREHWGLIDLPTMMMQLGLMPPPS